MNQISRGISLVAAAVLFMMMVVTFIDVGGRQLFNKPLHGATEINEIGLMLLVLLTLPMASMRRAHIKVDLFESFFPAFLHKVQLLITAILGAGLFATIAYRLWHNSQRALGYGDITAELELPTGFILMVMSVLCAATAVGFAASLFWQGKTPSELEKQQ